MDARIRPTKEIHVAPRVPPVIPGSKAELAPIEASIAAERGRIPLLYQVLLNSAPLAQGWEKLLTAVRNRSSLPPALREMVIIRVAVLNRAPYELDAHRPIALACGVSEAKIDALREPQLDDAFTPVERAALALTDAMTREVQVDDALFEPLREHFDERALVELVATIAAYNMVSRLLEALHIGR
jgi:AhpD family alkylhydroperoxidase